MTPREFCRRSLEALRLAPAPANPARYAAIETLLACFATDDVSPATFELQLGLLAESEFCPCISEAAERVRAMWGAERDPSSALAVAAGSN